MASHSEASLEPEKKSSLFSVLKEEEDESHLPPGVRRQNRCNSSSSEDEEDQAKKNGSDSSDSDSEREDRLKKQRLTGSKSKSPEAKPQEDEEPKPTEDQSASARKDSHKDSSRSRSRSGSPSHRHRKRRSSERSRSRSRSRDRKHKRDKRRSHRSRSRDRKRDRDHHKRRKDHRRSRSRSRDRRDRKRGDRSRRDRQGGRRDRDRSRSKDRSRRNRSRSSSPQPSKVIKFGDKVIKAGASFGRPVSTSSSSSSSSSSKPLTFKEKMRQQFIKAMEEGADVSTALTSTDGTVLCTQTAGTQQTTLIPAPKKPPVPLMATMVTSTAGLLATPTITASEAAMQSILQLQKETTAKTGVEIPSYYNPGAINPVKYAEQVQKRKLLWSKNKEKDVNSQWNTTSLSGEADDKSKEKFRKLMGIKQDSGEGGHETEQEMKQKQIFEQLDKEYQFARMATHTHRGIGLGFGSSTYHPPPSSTLPDPQQPPTTSSS